MFTVNPPTTTTMKKTMKKASRGMKRRKMGGDYMEPSKELKFGSPVKAKHGRRRAVLGIENGPQRKTDPNADLGTGNDFSSPRSQAEPSTAQRISTNVSQFPLRVRETNNIRAENMRNYGKNSTYGQSNAKSSNDSKNDSKKDDSKKDDSKKSSSTYSSVKMDPATGRPVGTGRPAQSSNKGSSKGKEAYNKAKASDSNLDSLTRQRNALRDAGKKGTSEYNEIQNKINRAYGKGPIRKVDPMKNLESRGPKQIENKSAPTRTIQTRTSTVDTSPTIPSKKGAKPDKPSREDKIKARTAKKVAKIKDRRAKAANRQKARGRKDEVRETAEGLGMSKGQVRAAGRMAKAKTKGKDAKAARMSDKFGDATEKRGKKRDQQNQRAEQQENKQLEQGRKSVQKQQNKSAREDQKMDNKDARLKKQRNRQDRRSLIKEGRKAVQSARKATRGGYKKASAGMMIAGKAGSMAADAMQNSNNETVQKLGKGLGFASQFAGMAGGGGGGAAAPAAKNGRYKAKSGFGMLSVKAGIDNNPNPTAADRIAGATKNSKDMKDRRNKARRKAQGGDYKEGTAKKPKDFGKNTNMEGYFKSMKEKDGMAGVNRLPGGVNDDGVERVQSIARKNDARRRAKNKKEQAAKRKSR